MAANDRCHIVITRGLLS